MDVGKLMAALAAVEQDHQLVVEKVQALKEAVTHLIDAEGAQPRRALERFQELDRFFSTRLMDHLQEEERDLFPFLEKELPDGAERVARLRREHDALTLKRKDFGVCLEVAVGLQEGLPRAVLSDLISYGWELWELLDTHAHTETQAIRQCVTRHLPPAQRQAAQG